jgi:hypothetical protein
MRSILAAEDRIDRGARKEREVVRAVEEHGHEPCEVVRRGHQCGRRRRMVHHVRSESFGPHEGVVTDRRVRVIRCGRSESAARHPHRFEHQGAHRPVESETGHLLHHASDQGVPVLGIHVDLARRKHAGWESLRQEVAQGMHVLGRRSRQAEIPALEAARVGQELAERHLPPERLGDREGGEIEVDVGVQVEETSVFEEHDPGRGHDLRHRADSETRSVRPNGRPRLDVRDPVAPGSHVPVSHEDGGEARNAGPGHVLDQDTVESGDPGIRLGVSFRGELSFRRRREHGQERPRSTNGQPGRMTSGRASRPASASRGPGSACPEFPFSSNVTDHHPYLRIRPDDRRSRGTSSGRAANVRGFRLPSTSARAGDSDSLHAHADRHRP